MDRDITRRFAAAWSSHDPDHFASIFSAGCLYEDIPLGVAARGTEQIRDHMRDWLSSSSDIVMTLTKDVLSDGMAAMEWTYTGTHDGVLEGIQPTGRAYEFRGASVFHVGDDGLIGSCVDYWDLNYLLGVLR
jgi:steroid delta-isomerase-like uncharacterized protein